MGYVLTDAEGKPILDEHGERQGDPVKRLLNDEHLVQNWSQRPLTTTGASTVCKWLAAAIAIQNAARRGDAASTDVAVWTGGSSQELITWQVVAITMVIAIVCGLCLGCSLNCVFRAVFRCCVGGLKGLFDCDMKITITRTVGVQSQTTYDRDADPSRFKAHENGSRRHGEVTIGWQPPFL